MTSPKPAIPADPVTRGAAKRQAILTGAFEAFATGGYTATIEAIVGAAGVSSRTIYKHFRDKDELYLTVIADSAHQIADAQIALMDAHLTNVTNIEAALVAFGLDWVEPIPGAEAHFALVRQIHADPGRIPTRALETWAEAGPNRVQQVLGDHLGSLANRGLLTIDDPTRAALHYGRLVTSGGPTWVAASPYRSNSQTPDSITADVRAAVHTFLYGHAPTETDTNSA